LSNSIFFGSLPSTAVGAGSGANSLRSATTTLSTATTTVASTATANHWGRVKADGSGTWENALSLSDPTVGNEHGWHYDTSGSSALGSAPEFRISNGSSFTFKFTLTFSVGQTIASGGFNCRLYSYDSVASAYSLMGTATNGPTLSYTSGGATTNTFTGSVSNGDWIFNQGVYLYAEIWVKLTNGGSQTIGISENTSSAALTLGSVDTREFDIVYMGGKGQRSVFSQAVNRAAFI